MSVGETEADVIEIPNDLEMLVLLRRPQPDGTVDVIGFEPIATRRAIFDECCGLASMLAESMAAEGGFSGAAPEES